MTTVRHAVRGEHFGDHLGEVFPTLGAFIGGGIIAGVTAAMIFAKIAESGNDGLLIQSFYSAGLGAIVGLFLGLSRGIWHSGGSLRPPELMSTSHRALGSLAR